jgi:putative membrane protein
MRKLLSITIILSILIITIQACNNRKAKNYNADGVLDDAGFNFIQNASEASLAEIEASTLAKKISKNPRIAKFADMLIIHHTQLGGELKQLQSQSQVNFADTISLDAQKNIAELAKKNGEDFDRGYINMMINDHKKTITLFNNARSKKPDPIDDFVKKNLSAIEAHLDSAKKIEKSLK